MPPPERPNLITRVKGGGGGPTLMLNGHLDTKPVGDSAALWRSDPLVPELSNGRIYGLGTSDMKGAVAAMVFAAAALRSTGTPLGGDVLLVFTADEEAGSSLGAQFLAPRLTGVDACLIGEPSGVDDDWQGVCLVSRGVCGFRIRVRGTQTHSSLSDRMPSVNASLVMAQLLLGIKAELELDFTPHPYGAVKPTLNPGVLVNGGVYFGVVPGMAEFACDLRTRSRDGRSWGPTVGRSVAGRKTTCGPIARRRGSVRTWAHLGPAGEAPCNPSARGGCLPVDRRGARADPTSRSFSRRDRRPVVPTGRHSHPPVARARDAVVLSRPERVRHARGGA